MAFAEHVFPCFFAIGVVFLAVGEDFDTDGDDIVMIMGNGGCDGAALKPEAAHEAGGDVAIAAMAFNHGNTGEIAMGDGAFVSGRGRNVFAQMLGYDLAGQNTDDIRLRAVSGMAKV